MEKTLKKTRSTSNLSKTTAAMTHQKWFYWKDLVEVRPVDKRAVFRQRRRFCLNYREKKRGLENKIKVTGGVCWTCVGIIGSRLVDRSAGSAR